MSAEPTWEALRSQHERPVFRRVNEGHPYDIYLGIDVADAPVMMLLSSTAVSELPRLKALEVSQTLRHDGKFALLVTLANAELVHPFRYVCDDLIESLRSHSGTAGAEATFMLHRLEKWRRLLEMSKRGLSQAEIYGLIGELVFLERLVSAIGSSAAVEAWLGPSGAPQDFQTGGHVYEIKTCTIGGHLVVISSLEQLNTGTTPASLIVYSIGSAGTETTGAFTLNELVGRIRKLLEGSSALSMLELKLTEVGYDDKQAEAEGPVVVPQVRAFNVAEDFPRLTPVRVAPGVASATYSIDLDRCKQFEIPISRVPGYDS